MMTQHARIRSQQRAIPPMVIELLIRFGKREAAGDGASKAYFDKAARRNLESYAGPLARYLDDHLDAYVVLGPEEQVITVAHRTERIRRQ